MLKKKFKQRKKTVYNKASKIVWKSPGGSTKADNNLKKKKKMQGQMAFLAAFMIFLFIFGS